MEELQSIRPLDEAAMERARKRWNAVAKPLDSLGLLEKLIVQIAGITGTEEVSLTRRCVVVFCGDHGVVEEGVAQSDAHVTALVAKSIAAGKSNINLMANECGAEVLAVDVGMKETVDVPGIQNKKIACGTNNFFKECAMSREQATAAIRVGIELAREKKAQGYAILLSGEMGIGNTTSAAAMASVLLDVPPREVVGRGSGLSDAELQRKIEVVEHALLLHQPDRTDALDLLSKVGGYELAAMTGLFLGGAISRIPVVIDGFLSATAALLAKALCAGSTDYMLPSQVSTERAGARVLDAIPKQAPITAQMRLGEGTGAVLLLPLLDAALAVYHSTHRFEALGMEAYKAR